jgi:hypothetical protein
VGVVLPCKLGSAPCILFAVDGVINLTLGRLLLSIKKSASAQDEHLEDIIWFVMMDPMSKKRLSHRGVWEVTRKTSPRKLN